ncbi:MAG: pyruvate ferredoxin oxidoreductase, partial [Methanomicrobiales archaeon]|nr:pyruvate ferredoxin oxidoreductase [Methanomicrobiales archaeon]
TPSSSLLHFLAGLETRFGLTVVHPENEIAVILMALGFAAAGKRAAVGTSGGGFCLMTEGLSLAGMAEIPVVILMSQRTGPSTGLPTYTGQADLRFVLHAGQGEFPRLIVAPGDAAEAFVWSARAMDLAWRYQVPAIILTDKTLSEGTYSMDLPPADTPPGGTISAGNPAGDSGQYLRYADSPGGVSPLAAAGTPGAVVKVNSYAHDEYGITTEEAGMVDRMVQKRERKGVALAEGLLHYSQVEVSGSRDAATALLCWGSTKGVCTETAGLLGLRVVRPVVLAPFPAAQLKTAFSGVSRCIAVEENASAQLAGLARGESILVHDTILRSDGRPFTPEDLVVRIREVLS